MVGGMGRREFLKLGGAGLGVVVTSGLLGDQLWAGEAAVTAADLFEQRFGISRQVMRKVLDAALSRGGDYADLFFEHKTSSSVSIEDDIVKESSEEITLGVGIRVLAGMQTGYGFTSELTMEAMQRAALTAAAIASSTTPGRCARLRPRRRAAQVYEMAEPLTTAPLGDKIVLVKEAYTEALSRDPRVSRATASLADELQLVAIATSEGLLVSDTRPQVRLVVRATAEEGASRATGSANGGGRVGAAFYRRSGSTPKEIGKRAAAEAVTLLKASNATPGEQPVVLGPNHSGVMIHEAVGHPLEGDGAWRKTSIMWDRLGQTVASPLVTIYDDTTLPGLRGSLNMDDEGTPCGKAMLIERGVLVGYLHDRLSARMLKVKPNGHGRRESFTEMPIPRMGNTILASGQTPPEEILGSVKKGFYADTYQGGEVDDTGKFTFSVNLGYEIEDGKLTRPVKNATLIGTNVQVLKDVEMVGNDMGFFLGTCGKGGQWVPVTAGTPTVKIRQMTVGGRA